MFYLTGNVTQKKPVLYGVADTDDGVEDFLSLGDILLSERQGFKIYGIFRNSGRVFFHGMTPDAVVLLHKQRGTPVRVKRTGGLDYEQALYMGHRVTPKGVDFLFFDDGGMSGYYVLSNDYFVAHKDDLALDFKRNDHRRVAVLTRRMKDSGGFEI